MSEHTASTIDELQLVSFNLGDEEYGFDILKVQEINRMAEISKIPRAPDYVEGLINLRGKVIPIISLRKRLGLPEKQQDKETRIIVITIEGKVLGLVVDAVSEVLRVPSNTIEAAPAVASSHGADYIKGVAKIGEKLLILLNLEKLFSTVETDLGETVA